MIGYISLKDVNILSVDGKKSICGHLAAVKSEHGVL
jgi:hypothetical protein